MIKVNGKEIKFEQFPNGELRANTYSPSRQNTYVILKFENHDDLIKLYFIKRELDNQYSDIKVNLTILYMPYSRMDRTQGEYMFTLKYICDFINSMNFNSITLNDPHSDVTPALLNNTYCQYPLHGNILYSLNNIPDNILYYPDTGAYKKYSAMFQREGAIGLKTRDFSTGAIKDFQVIGDVKDKNILIVDDLCSYGGTFVKGAQKLKELGAKDIYLYVTHCEDNIFKGDVFSSGLFKKVVTTNSIISDNQGVENLIVIDIMGD